MEQLLIHIFKRRLTFHIYQTEYGWVCHPISSGRDSQNRPHPGQGNFVVDAETGVVTAHSSLHPQTIGEQYDEAIRTGQPVQGRQIHPPRWSVTVQRIREDQTEIEYHVLTRPLLETADPTTDLQLTIDKKTLRSRTNERGIPEPASLAKSWAYANRHNEIWPEQGTFEY
ncbi:hypothetical protein ACFVUS_16825 [Nocardia sp. NPDC058058]|uniref:hypothetical protein n=1 Tax=Nocardia sp. NPDC058058 TaxID=3346317 RepID=UPI0036DAEDDA